ncbi:MAG: response regulator receiver protein [Gallionellales bacterium RBG_16_56_9]|nr:MAG: response regulator receiver protein [Gallionellales bacterium RBG_16_56_9]
MATILIVEDNPANMKLATAILENAGHTVLQAENAPDGIALARANAPGLILMDIQLPGMNGLEAIAILKEDPATRAIPVIALTAFAMKDEEGKIRASGCDSYLAKPFHYKELLAAVDRLLGNKPGA